MFLFPGFTVSLYRKVCTQDSGKLLSTFYFIYTAQDFFVCIYISIYPVLKRKSFLSLPSSFLNCFGLVALILLVFRSSGVVCFLG